MKYNIKGEGVELTESLNEFVQSRLDALNKYFVIDDSTQATVKLSAGRGGTKKIEVFKVNSADDDVDALADDELVLKKGGDELLKKVEVTIPTKHGNFRAEASDKDLITAIDRVVDKLEAQIRKQKTKLANNRRKAEKIGFALSNAYFEGDNEADMLIVDEDDDAVVREKQITPEAKDIDTAILEMEMLGHDFYIYRDMDTEQIHVVYKRKAGGYGVIATKTE